MDEKVKFDIALQHWVQEVENLSNNGSSPGQMKDQPLIFLI